MFKPYFMLKNLLIVLTLCFVGCVVSTSNSGITNNNVEDQNSKCIQDTLHSVFRPLFDEIDPSLIFETKEELNAYLRIVGFNNYFNLKLDSLYKNNSHIANSDYERAIIKLQNILFFMEYKITKEQIKKGVFPVTFRLPFGFEGEGLLSSKEIEETLASIPLSKRSQEVKDVVNELVFRQNMVNKPFTINPQSYLLTKDSVRYSNLDEILDKNKSKIIMFGASWCKPCLVNERKFSSLKDLIDLQNIQLIKLSIDENRDKWVNYLERDKSEFSHYNIKELNLQSVFSSRSIPKILFLDENNSVKFITDDVIYLLKNLPNTCVTQ